MIRARSTAFPVITECGLLNSVAPFYSDILYHARLPNEQAGGHADHNGAASPAST